MLTSSSAAEVDGELDTRIEAAIDATPASNGPGSTSTSADGLIEMSTSASSSPTAIEEELQSTSARSFEHPKKSQKVPPSRSLRPLARVILIRHPQTQANAAHILQGTTDSPLTDLGAEQSRELAKWFSRTQEGRMDQEGSEDVKVLEEMDVRIIVHSPLGRTSRLGREIHSALSTNHRDQLIPTDLASSSASSSSSSTCNKEGVQLQPSHDLREKSFGPQECTRKGVHAGPRWPRGTPGSKPEGGEEFRRRVTRAGKLWLGKARDLGNTHDEKEEEGTAEDESQDPIDSSTMTRSRQSRMRSRKIPTLLLITHGLFISTFFRSFPVIPAFSTSLEGTSNDMRIPFASNTGMYILDVLSGGSTPTTVRSVSPSSMDAGTRLRLIRANWTPHLPDQPPTWGVRASSKRSGLDNAARDPKQRKLDTLGFFTLSRRGDEGTLQPLTSDALEEEGERGKERMNH